MIVRDCDRLRISLIAHPWASTAGHVLDVSGPADLHWQLRALPPQRWAVALWLAPEDDWRRDELLPGTAAKPYVVLAGLPSSPRQIVSADGFLVLRTGGEFDRKLCEAAWAEILEQPRRERKYAAFFQGLSGFCRRAVYPPPELVRTDGHG